MLGILFFLIVSVIVAYLKEIDSKVGTSGSNIYNRHNIPIENASEVLEQIRKPAIVNYIMDHGISATHTHEYCYLSYLEINIANERLAKTRLFDYSTMTFSPLRTISPIILEAAKSYLSDRTTYMGFLN